MERGWIERYEKGRLVRMKTLTEALNLTPEGFRVVSLVGAGGKTTVMYRLADELAGRKKRVIVTASTHIRRPEGREVLLAQRAEDLREAAWEEPVLVLGRDSEGGKLTSLPGDEIDGLKNWADVVLIEADGAKCMPLKVPRETEPVIARSTELVIALAGLSCLGKTLESGCFRWREAAGWLPGEGGRPPGEDTVIGPDLVAAILSEERGSRKAVGDLPYRIVLNQADRKDERRQAVEIIEQLPKRLREGVVITAGL